VSWYKKGKTNLDFTEAIDSQWQWHQLGHMQVSISLQTDNHGITPPLKFFTGWMPFLQPNQQHQSTEGRKVNLVKKVENLDLNEVRDYGVLGWQWHQLDHMQTICTFVQITTATPHHSIFTGRLLFRMPKQHYQSTEGKKANYNKSQNVNNAYLRMSCEC